MKKCLIFLEKGAEQYSVDLLAAADKMYGEPYRSVAVSAGADISAAEGYFDEIIQAEDERVREYDIQSLADVMSQLQEEYEFDSILIQASFYGRMLAPRLAMRLKAGLVADVTEISADEEGNTVMVRPAFSGKIMAGIVKTKDGPVMMSIRPGLFLAEKREKKDTEIIRFTPEAVLKSGIRRISQTQKEIQKDIRDSEVIVSGGGGILNDFPLLDRLSERLGGMTGASRKAVDSGKADRSIQVGQSGKTVHPRLYIAAGIYGALQHVAGLNRVEHLIALNTNPDAPICSLADIVVEGDAREFIEKLIERINR